MLKSKKSRLETLKKRILKENLLLKDSSTNLVFEKGNPEAAIIFIGEAPGNAEDIQGLPFVGRAGKTLDRLLHLIGFNIDEVYITNILKYRPPKNRNPSIKEIINHTPCLLHQIKIIKPKVIVTLGNFATRFTLSGFNIEKMPSVPGIAKLHGQVKRIRLDGLEFSVVPLYHPAATFYNPSLRKTLEKDFKNLEVLLNSF